MYQAAVWQHVNFEGIYVVIPLDESICIRLPKSVYGYKLGSNMLYWVQIEKIKRMAKQTNANSVKQCIQGVFYIDYTQVSRVLYFRVS